MKTTLRILVALSLPIAFGACSPQPSDTAAKAEAPAKAKTAAAEKTDKDETADKEKTVAANETKDGPGCIYAEGEKDEGEKGCPHGPGGEALAKAGGEGHFGSAFTLADAKPLSKAIEAGAGEAPVLVEGEVEAVCQKKGCWMVIKDGANQARVLMKDHGFAVPMDCRGKKAVIEGTLASRTFSEAQVKHLAKDGGADPEAVSGERTEHVLTASGVLIQS